MFDPKYIMDPLKAVDADEIILTMNEATSPKLITVKGLPYLCVVMPIRIH
jgi:DNA polymerase III sliding clamp (beta) subunit (PCNA family)